MRRRPVLVFSICRAAETSLPALPSGVAEIAARMRLLVEASDLAQVMLDRRGQVISWNRGAERLMGHRPGAIVGRHVSTLRAVDEPENANRWLDAAARDGGREDEGWWVRRDGSRVWMSVITTPLRDGSSELCGFLCIVRDASVRRHADLALQKTAEGLEQLAATDPLTGLKNRREFDRMLRTIPREPFAVLAIDIDHFKAVNDDNGHDAGDVLLRTIATTLALLVRGWDVLARTGGDEFAALLPGAGREEAAKVAERMRVAMHGMPSRSARISVGWASAPAGADPQTVWTVADMHLYRAKRSGRDQVVGSEFVVDDTPRISGPSNTETLTELLAGGAVDAVYQPIVGLGDGHVLGYEALARPAHFSATDSVETLFRMARQTERICDLDWICRKAAFRDAGRLPDGATLFVNVSASALLDPMHDVDQLLLLLRWGDWTAARTVLELGEHEPISDLRRLAAVLARYRAEGVRFALDDVGEGHSTLELLAAAEPEFIKVARSLTMTASRDASRAAIEAALAFGRSSGAVTIAEGVENQFAADQMQSMGIELGQGFGLAVPTAPDATADTVAGWLARSALRPLRPRAPEARP